MFAKGYVATTNIATLAYLAMLVMQVAQGTFDFVEGLQPHLA